MQGSGLELQSQADRSETNFGIIPLCILPGYWIRMLPGRIGFLQDPCAFSPVLSSCPHSVSSSPWATKVSSMASGLEMLLHPPHVLARWGIQLVACIRGFQERKPTKISKEFYFKPSSADTIYTKGVCRSGQNIGGLKKDWARATSVLTNRLQRCCGIRLIDQIN